MMEMQNKLYFVDGHRSPAIEYRNSSFTSLKYNTGKNTILHNTIKSGYEFCRVN